MPRECVDAILGVILPPVQVFRKKKAGKEFWIDLILFLLYIFGFGWLSVIYCFYAAEGVDILPAIFCLLIPPLGLWLGTKQCNMDILICLLLCFLFFLLGKIYAYFKV